MQALRVSLLKIIPFTRHLPIMVCTDADRDAKKRWATGMAAQSMLGGIGGGLTSTVIGGLGRAAVGKVFG